MANKPTLDEMRLALSKVPKTLYHGTGADIKEFRPNSFLSDDPKIAGMYAKSQHRAVEGSGPNIMPVHANLKNPFIFDESDARRQGSSFGKMIAPHASTKNRFSEAIKILKAKGHDGVVLQNFDDIGGRQNQYIVFDPRHIKSAIGNRGTYDINDPDITKSNGGEVLPHHQREANKAKFLEPSKAKERLYHATGADIKEFDKSKVKRPYFGHGFHMAESPTLANFYADQHKEGQNVMPVHAQIKNPFVLKSMTDWYDVPGNTDAERTNWVKSQGYDGIKYPHGAPYNAPHESGTGWVAFEPTQIKSAIGNRGTFDSNFADINKAKGGGIDNFLKKSKIKQRVYHGTGANIADFKPSKMGAMGPGIYVSTDPKVASGYANVINNGREQNNPNVMPLHIQARNPFTISHVNKSHDELFKHFDPEGKLTDDQVIELVKKAGYDSIHATESGEINMLDPRRIKSAIGNRGTYDTRDPIITRAKGGKVTHAHHLEIEERPL